MSAEALWGSVERELSASLPAHAVSAWFDPIFPLALTENELVLQVPNRFFYEWIESHYKKSISKALSAVSNQNIKHRLVISSNEKDIGGDGLVFETIKREPVVPHGLNKNYLFDSFIEGTNNQFAKTASETVADELAKQSFNPLIIYGGVGLGKTHLLHAIGNQVFKKTPSARVVLATSEKFTLDFVNSLRKNKTTEFAKQYRQADVLLIDDIQFFRGKEQTQEQFFHTFNELYQSGRQIVMTADRFPGEMKGLKDRLLSRFQSGLSVDIQPPDFEMRVAILLDKAEQNGVELNYDIIEFIATHVKNNIRDLEGTIIRILAKSSLMNRDIDFDLAKEAVRERVGKQISPTISVEDVVRRVSDLFRVKEKAIVGKSRKAEIVEARQVCMYLCRCLIGDSLSNIGVYFGGRDHTTVIHALQTVEKKKKKNKKLESAIGRIEQELGFGSL
ncbi:MAG: chromosomal replication initiator protein DnaA [Candidatus Marinimicrobia bacterium]|nr:chromosomal replication initiator protein DnaA [Candidatus Neomarinimicrobiota bacterium]|tara:strand:- start:29092 stop:30432 length:1341 start_codon:yes stop_codon:yes gene_type:complete